MWVDGIVGLLVKGSLEEAVGDGSLACASVLAAPEASKLGGLDCVARHGKLEKVLAREDCSGEGRSEAPVCRSPSMVMACWCSCSADGASVGQEVMILGVTVALAVGGLQMASSESA